MVWLINGLLCKVLGLAPRHQAIVARILGPEHASTLTILIGISEILMAVWICSRKFPRLNTITQIALVVIMNFLETIVAPDLLLWGHWNLLWALLFCVLVWKNHQLSET